MYNFNLLKTVLNQLITTLARNRSKITYFFGFIFPKNVYLFITEINV